MNVAPKTRFIYFLFVYLCILNIIAYLLIGNVDLKLTSYYTLVSFQCTYVEDSGKIGSPRTLTQCFMGFLNEEFSFL